MKIETVTYTKSYTFSSIVFNYEHVTVTGETASKLFDRSQDMRQHLLENSYRPSIWILDIIPTNHPELVETWQLFQVCQSIQDGILFMEQQFHNMTARIEHLVLVFRKDEDIYESFIEWGENLEERQSLIRLLYNRRHNKFYLKSTTSISFGKRFENSFKEISEEDAEKIFKSRTQLIADWDKKMARQRKQQTH